MRLSTTLLGRLVAVLVAVLLLAATFVLLSGGGEQRHLTAHFSRAVAIYKGSDVRLMGVRIGRVDAVVPEGDSVRVEMTYDGEYDLPADAKAAIITPTLVADRFVQVSPAYTSGPKMRDGADIPLSRTGTPVELDRIYQSINKLSTALGPNGVNRKGALSQLVAATAGAMRGQGGVANQTIHDMASAAELFSDNRGPLFDSVRQLAELTDTLARNDDVVTGFMTDLSSVSAQLAGERVQLQRAVAALARAVGTVRTFVHDNRELVKDNIEELNQVLGVLAKEQKALGTGLQLAPLGLGNLATAYDVKTGSVGARFQFGPTVQSLGNILCDVVVNSKVPNTGTICQLLKAITAPLANRGVDLGSAVQVPIPGGDVGWMRPKTSLAGVLGGTP